jgi:hypothetical protein
VGLILLTLMSLEYLVLGFDDFEEFPWTAARKGKTHARAHPNKR